MKSITINGTLRAEVGSKEAKNSRVEGNVPCVLYGGDAPVHFSCDEREFNNLLYTPSVYLVKVVVGDKEYTSIVQATQFHPITDKIVHVDFLEVTPGKPIKVSLPVRTVGTALGVRNGGRLGVPMKKLRVSGLVDDMPDDIEINVEKLRIGHKVRIGDLNISGITFLDDSKLEVCGVKTKRGAIEDEEEDEEGAEGEEGAEASTEGAEAPAEEKAAE